MIIELRQYLLRLSGRRHLGSDLGLGLIPLNGETRSRKKRSIHPTYRIAKGSVPDRSFKGLRHPRSQSCGFKRQDAPLYRYLCFVFIICTLELWEPGSGTFNFPDWRGLGFLVQAFFIPVEGVGVWSAGEEDYLRCHSDCATAIERRYQSLARTNESA